MAKAKVLLQLDCDDHVSSFDSLVAIDSGVDQLLTWSGIEPVNVQPLVHGAMFTRGGDDLRHTAIFLGGSDAVEVDAVLRQVEACFFGPVRVSVMADPNGCNTTAAAAVLSIQKQTVLTGKKVVVLGATGPVGSRIARLMAEEGAGVKLVSRSLARAEATRDGIRERFPEASVEVHQTDSPEQNLELARECSVIVSAGAAGIPLLPDGWWEGLPAGTVAVDCNAVPPAGLPGVSASDKGAVLGRGTVFGAIGIGGLKMKIHRECLGRLFQRNDLVLDLAEIMAVGAELVRGP